MKYIKLFENESFKEIMVNDYHSDIPNSIRIKSDFEKKIDSYFNSYDASIMGNVLIYKRYEINNNYFSVDIYLNNDDFFYIKFFNNKFDLYQYYKCDQLSGLLKLLKSKKIPYT